MLATIALGLFPAAPAPAAPAGGDLIIGPGEVLVYDTALGPLFVDDLVIHPGGSLVAHGPLPLVVLATGGIQVDGLLDASGFDAHPVGSLFTPFLPEPGAGGGPSGGTGGIGSPASTESSPKGGDGEAVLGIPGRGGRGGETGYSPSPDIQHRRGAGGGGGALGPDAAGGGPGLVAEPGNDGHPLGLGAITGVSPPKGGAVGRTPFQDGSPANDFWGVGLDPATGVTIQGELASPRAGAGGGAGGDSILSATFPTIPFGPPYIDKKGAGAGGGGGLAILIAKTFALGAEGHVRVDGGDGATGENVLGFDHIAGSSGGGSGGMLIVQARRVDLTRAPADGLSARGGIGGIGATSGAIGASKGGNGGPGLLQIHVADPATDVILAPGTTVADVSEPDAHVLLPAF